MAWKKLPKQFSCPKKVIDKFDIEAEKEGSAIIASTEFRPHSAKGKRTLKDQNRESRGDSINTNKVHKRYMIG